MGLVANNALLSRMIFPNEPTNKNSVSAWCRRLLLACRASEVKAGPGYRVKRASGGTTLEIDFGGGSTNSVSVKWCKIQSIQDDYVTVLEWDGSATTGSSFYVAKPTKLRYNGGASETIDGITVTYSSWAATTRVTRVASISGAAAEDQVIVPRLQVNDLIWAIQVTETGVTVSGADVTWLDLNIDARAWCFANEP